MGYRIASRYRRFGVVGQLQLGREVPPHPARHRRREQLPGAGRQPARARPDAGLGGPGRGRSARTTTAGSGPRSARRSPPTSGPSRSTRATPTGSSSARGPASIARPTAASRSTSSTRASRIAARSACPARRTSWSTRPTAPRCGPRSRWPACTAAPTAATRGPPRRARPVGVPRRRPRLHRAPDRATRRSWSSRRRTGSPAATTTATLVVARVRLVPGLQVRHRVLPLRARAVERRHRHRVRRRLHPWRHRARWRSHATAATRGSASTCPPRRTPRCTGWP